MENNELILSRFKMSETVYYIMDCKILQKNVLGLRAEMLMRSNGILETLRYRIDITSNNGWVRPEQLFESKIEAGEYLLEINGLDVTMKEVEK